MCKEDAKDVIWRGKTKDDCLNQLGYALLYMTWLNPRFLRSKCSQEQQKRVHELCAVMALHWHLSDGDSYWQQFYREIEDEIENML